MKIYSDLLSRATVAAAHFDASLEASCTTLEMPSIWKPRRHAYGVEVRLTGWGARHTRYVNLGTATRSGWNHADSGGDFAATWMDWGWFIAVMFRHDPLARIGQYDNREDFLAQTARAFPHRLKVDRKHGAADFARTFAAKWTEGTSPFLFVDTLCPPARLVNLTHPEVVESWLATA